MDVRTEDKPWLEQLLRPLIVAVLISCVAASWAWLLRIMLPDWNDGYLIALCFLAAMEAFISHRLLRTRLDRLDARWRYRAAEIFSLYFLMQVAVNIGAGRANIFANIPNFEPETLFAFFLVMGCWAAATWTASELEDLGRAPEDYQSYRPPAESLYARFFVGAAILLTGTGISYINVATVFDLSRPGAPGLVLNVALYFLLGVMMLGQMQYAVLNQRWRSQGTRVAEGLAGRWVRYTAVLLVAVALVAFMLPTGYTVGLLDVGRYVLTVLFALIVLVISLLLFPIMWLLSLLGIGTGEVGDRRALTPLDLPPPPPASGGNDFFELLRSLLFWAVALGIAAYFTRSFLRHGGGSSILRWLAGLAPVRLLLRLWNALWGRLRGYARVVAQNLPRRGTPVALPERTPTPRRSLFRRPGSLPPREQVLYYYIDTVRRAGKQGFPRRRNQTPQEYRASLEPNLPEGQPDIEGLTRAFIEARYSPHEVEMEEAGQARSRWQRLGDALKSLTRDQDARRT